MHATLHKKALADIRNFHSTTANSALKAYDLSHIIRSCKPDIIVTLAGQGGIDVVQDALKELQDDYLASLYHSERLFTVDLSQDDYGLNSLAAQPTTGNGSVRDWKWLLEDESKMETFQIAQFDSEKKENDRRAAVILWSSGTSGKSKGVVLSHRALIASILSFYYGNLDLDPHEVSEP